MNQSNINLHDAHFICSAPRLQNCPADTGREVAFAGRSNAGKSSAINCLTSQKKLARTSKTPGRTQQINFFSISEEARLVDLPGYGYAKVPEAMKRAWQESMQDYLENRVSLKGIVLLMDIRHPLKDFDRLMMDWANQYQMPMHILLTKADKLKAGAQKNELSRLKELLLKEDYPLCSTQLFSAMKAIGVKEAQSAIIDWLSDEHDQ